MQNVRAARVPRFWKSRSRQGNGTRITRLIPRTAQSVGLMKENSARIAAHCPVCCTTFRVDPDAIIHAKGRAYSLVDQQGPCRRYRCTGLAFFTYSPAANTPWRALTTDTGGTSRILDGITDPTLSPPDDNDPTPPVPPAPPLRARRGVDQSAWANADESEQKLLVRRARD